jgi:hypothetical protein
VRKTDFFAVQRCLDPSTLAFDRPITVEASNALEAAEKVLGQTVSAIGDKSELAAQVLQLTHDYRTSTTMVFRLATTG